MKNVPCSGSKPAKYSVKAKHQQSCRLQKLCQDTREKVKFMTPGT